MLVTGFAAGALAANCYVVASAQAQECIIIDPGQDAAPGIDEILDRYRLKPIAVLVTHGHFDHCFSVAPVCGAKGVPAYIHTADRALLSDPMKGFPQAREIFPGVSFTEPDDVKELADGAALSLAGLDIVVTHTPGHTGGSVTFAAEGTLFSGDLLFAGSIGRTDLPGGDDAQMRDSLAKTMKLPDETVVLPGHGPQTTIGGERAANPFVGAARGL